MSEIFLDTETTGLSYQNGDKIVEIACIETVDLIPTKKIFHKLINPKRDVPDGAYKIHGFSTEFLKSKETFEEIVDDFLNFIKGKKIIIHNATFDVGFLNNELNLLKKETIKKEYIIDSLDVARLKYPGTSNSLDALCRRFGIDLSRRTKHNALLDCELLREVYINLLDAKEPKLIFTNEKSLSTNEINIASTSNYSKKIIEISTQEKESHKEFLKKEVKKNFF